MDTNTEVKPNDLLGKLFNAGAHFGYAKSRRHPTATPFIFGAKNSVDIFDLEKTAGALDKAKAFVKELASVGKQVIFVSSKKEAEEAIRSGAGSVLMPYVVGRWIGGTLTNFSIVRSRVDKLLDLRDKREKGELAKYTKKERLLIDREIAKLERLFSGLIPLKTPPAAVFVIDPRKEKTAVNEARQMGIPIIAVAGTDCDMKVSEYSIFANDSSRRSISFFVNEIAEAYKSGKNEVK